MARRGVFLRIAAALIVAECDSGSSPSSVGARGLRDGFRAAANSRLVGGVFARFLAGDTKFTRF
jgi:hypothetical protein